VTLRALLHHTVQVPATSANLGAGFDAHGLALDLHLAVRTVDRGAQGPRVVTTGVGAEDLPDGDDNLVWRSLVDGCAHLGVPVPDVALVVHNRIPLERGLGSSSAAIVAGLVLARAVTGTAVGERELVELASSLEGHPDNVAPALLGGLVSGSRTDDGRLVVRRINPLPGHLALALVPSDRQVTEASRGELPDRLDRHDVVDQVSRAAHVLVGLAGGWPIDAGLTGDRLHEPGRVARLPDGGALLAALRAEGLPAWLSGSGPTVLVLVREDDPDAIAAVTARVGDAAQVIPLALDRLGALACPDGGCAISGVGGCAQCPRERLR
jgi:homoserine kinase